MRYVVGVSFIVALTMLTWISLAGAGGNCVYQCHYGFCTQTCF